AVADSPSKDELKRERRAARRERELARRKALYQGASYVELFGASVLVLAVVAAWVLAVVVASDEVVASVFAASGFALVLAAVFFTRVREVSRGGVKLDPWRALEAAQKTAVQ